MLVVPEKAGRREKRRADPVHETDLEEDELEIIRRDVAGLGIDQWPAPSSSKLDLVKRALAPARSGRLAAQKASEVAA
jgi:hypothetical protein